MSNKKKLMIYTCYPCFPRLETELEIADLHRKEGYDIIFLSCMGELKSCYPYNPQHYKLKCSSCTSRLKAGYKWIGEDNTTLKRMYHVYPEQEEIISNVLSQQLNCWEDLRSIKINDDDVGEAAFSELVSTLRDTNPFFNKKNIDLAYKLLENSLMTHFSILNHLTEEKPDKFILFNGRISAYRPALRLGVSLGIDTKVLEVHFTNYNKYILTDMTYPHNPNIIAKNIVLANENSTKTEAERKQIASKWYKDREHGSGDHQLIYTEKQDEGYEVTKKADDNTLKVGLFVSSEDEFLTIPEHKSPYYVNQNDGIARIADDLKNENIVFIVRAHPHLIGLDNTQTKDLKNVCDTRSNIDYIPPESKINTYELIDICDIVLTFGSMVGIEAVHKNKPSILMGNSAYRGLNGNIEPESHEELMEILRESSKCGYVSARYMPTIEEMQNAATKFAFGFFDFGVEQQYQKLTSFSNHSWIEINGVRSYIRPHLIYRFTDLMFRVMNITNKLSHNPIKYLKEISNH